MTADRGRLTRLDWPDGDFRFAPAFWPSLSADALLERLRAEIPWHHHVVRLFGRDVPAPRLSAWHGDADADYRYSGHHYVPEPWTPALADIRREIGAATGELVNGVLANRYRDGRDGMGWHSDSEKELGPQPVIVSASFGASRRFVLRHRTTGRREILVLGHGSVLVMAGDSQRHWQHALPKTARPTGERINLTFRRVYPSTKRSAAPSEAIPR